MNPKSAKITGDEAIPETAKLKRAEFTTLQTRLVKIGARIIETATRIRIAFASACPDKALIAQLARSLATPRESRTTGSLTAPSQNAPQARQPKHPNPDQRTWKRERIALA